MKVGECFNLVSDLGLNDSRLGAHAWRTWLGDVVA